MVSTANEEKWSPVRRLNLNLLYPLDAILNAPSLTEAGRRVCLSQSAMSHALRRLRAHFNDELVEHASGVQVLTTLGSALRPEIRRLMGELEGAFNFSLDFDPSNSTRSITIAASEAIEFLLLTRFQRRVSLEAPGLSLSILPLDILAPERSLEMGADVLLLPAFAAKASLETKPLLVETLACMVRADHPALDKNGSISPATYAAADHIVALSDQTAAVPSDPGGENMLAARNIGMRVTSQAAIPWFILESDLIATGSSWLFQAYASMMPLAVSAAPFAAQRVPIVLQWSASRRHDPMLAWLTELLEEAAAPYAPVIPL
ncbi:MAG: LysR family transcriptional regulator [Sphingopyxis sp.]|nr:LysR family transcriptional regulator [Sphingopyxis sp.]